MPFGRKHRGAGKKAHGGEAACPELAVALSVVEGIVEWEESSSIDSLKANQKVKLIYWRRH